MLKLLREKMERELKDTRKIIYEQNEKINKEIEIIKLKEAEILVTKITWTEKKRKNQ